MKRVFGSVDDPSLHPLMLPGLLASIVWMSAPTLQSAAANPTSTERVCPFVFNCSAGVKESWDDNVFLQSQTDRANRTSFVTTLLPALAGKWTPNPALSLGLSYAAEVALFDSEPGENYWLHRTGLNLSGQTDKTRYELTVGWVRIDGSAVGPTWTGQGGAPATGGPAVRDRRDASVIRESFQLTQEFGAWRARAATTFYGHDFGTEQHSTPGYQNYVDRDEITGGGDLGRKCGPSVTAWTGYRFGCQDQAKLFAYPEQYGNYFNRVLLTLEGSPARWLKLNLSLGPEWRRFAATVPVTFGARDRLNLFVDSSVTILPTTADTLMISMKQFEQPGFAGRSVYTDLTYDFSWRHKFDDRFTAGIGGRAYNTYFFRPVLRNDWVLSANLFINCALTRQLNLEASYAYEQGRSTMPNNSGRDYTRHILTCGLKYVFPSPK